MPVLRKMQFEISKKKSVSSAEEEKKFEKFLEKKKIMFEELPIPSKTQLTIIKGIRKVPHSSLALVGVEDPRAMTLEARKWFRQTNNHENSDDSFFVVKAASKNKRFWEDDNVSDEEYDADAEIIEKCTFIK